MHPAITVKTARASLGHSVGDTRFIRKDNRLIISVPFNSKTIIISGCAKWHIRVSDCRNSSQHHSGNQANHRKLPQKHLHFTILLYGYYLRQLYITLQTVGASIARPTYTDDTIKSKIIVPAGMGRAMLAPTVSPDLI